jgi:hypothetical protein
LRINILYKDIKTQFSYAYFKALKSYTVAAQKNQQQKKLRNQQIKKLKIKNTEIFFTHGTGTVIP